MRTLRMVKGMTKAELAEAAGLHINTIVLIEQGSNADVRLGTIEAIAKVLEVDAAAIVGAL